MLVSPFLLREKPSPAPPPCFLFFFWPSSNSFSISIETWFSSNCLIFFCPRLSWHTSNTVRTWSANKVWDWWFNYNFVPTTTEAAIIIFSRVVSRRSISVNKNFTSSKRRLICSWVCWVATSDLVSRLDVFSKLKAITQMYISDVLYFLWWQNLYQWVTDLDHLFIYMYGFWVEELRTGNSVRVSIFFTLASGEQLKKVKRSCLNYLARTSSICFLYVWLSVSR